MNIARLVRSEIGQQGWGEEDTVIYAFDYRHFKHSLPILGS